MKRSNLVLLGFLALLTACAVACTGLLGAGTPKDVSTQLTGKVRLTLAASNKPVEDASRVVVWLKAPDLSRALWKVPPQTYRMVQRNKMFEPNFLVVPVGSLVDFPNLDPWFHNVFSLYQGKRFDLGLYEAGTHKEIKFDREGASYIFCNIHPEMAAVIVTVDSHFYGVSDKSGRFLIPNVPSGKYEIHMWYDNATGEELNAAQQTIDVEPGSENLPSMSLTITPHSTKNHKNKYGRDYDPKAAGSDYEN